MNPDDEELRLLRGTLRKLVEEGRLGALKPQPGALYNPLPNQSTYTAWAASNALVTLVSRFITADLSLQQLRRVLADTLDLTDLMIERRKRRRDQEAP